jgi:hypothetical protein
MINVWGNRYANYSNWLLHNIHVSKDHILPYKYVQLLYDNKRRSSQGTSEKLNQYIIIKGDLLND